MKKLRHSNTTLVKVKFMKMTVTRLDISNSNTTLVKVKFSPSSSKASPKNIQIQHLLKLNASKINTFINNYSL